MNNSYKSSLIKAFIASIFCASMFYVLLFVGSSLLVAFASFDLYVLMLISTSIAALSTIFFFFFNYITIEVTPEEIVFYRFNKKYRSIPMDANEIGSHIFKQSIYFIPVHTSYSISVRLNNTDKHAKKYSCTAFSKKTFVAMFSDIKILRSKSA